MQEFRLPELFSDDNVVILEESSSVRYLSNENRFLLIMICNEINY